MRLLQLTSTLVVSTVLLAASVFVIPAATQESLGLCEKSGERDVQSSIADSLLFCFDGSVLTLRNEGEFVFLIKGGENPKRKQHQWTPGGERVLYGLSSPLAGEPVVGDRVVPPGYTLELEIGAATSEIVVTVDGENSATFASRQFKVSLYGFVPVAGDWLDAVTGLNDFIDEMDDASIEYLDCQRRSTNFFSGGKCNLAHKWNVTFAVGRAAASVVPLINDIPKVIDKIASFVGNVDKAKSWGDLTAGALSDLGGWVDGQNITISQAGDVSVTVDREGLPAVPFGSTADLAISQIARDLGPPTIDTGWVGDFSIFDPGWGGLQPFQEIYLTYRRTCWFPEELCLLHGQTVQDNERLFLGWSLGLAGYYESGVPGSVRTIEGLTPGVTLAQVDEVTPVSAEGGEGGAAGFSGDYFGVLGEAWNPGSPEPDFSTTRVRCLGAGTILDSGWVLGHDACPYLSPQDAVSPRPAGEPIEPQWVAILDSLPTAESDAGDATRRAAEFSNSLNWVGPIVVFESDGYGSLNPGFWVIAMTAWDRSEEAAKIVCQDVVGEPIAADKGCYQRWVGSAPIEPTP